MSINQAALALVEPEREKQVELKHTPLEKAREQLKCRLEAIYQTLPADTTAGIADELYAEHRALNKARVNTSFLGGRDAEEAVAEAKRAQKAIKKLEHTKVPQLRERYAQQTAVSGQMEQLFAETVRDLSRQTVKASGMLWNAEQLDVLNWFIENQLSVVTSAYKRLPGVMENTFTHVEPGPMEQRGAERRNFDDPHFQGRLTKVLGQRAAVLLIGELKDLPFQYLDGELLLNHNRVQRLTLDWLLKNDPEKDRILQGQRSR